MTQRNYEMKRATFLYRRICQTDQTAAEPIKTNQFVLCSRGKTRCRVRRSLKQYEPRKVERFKRMKDMDGKRCACGGPHVARHYARDYVGILIGERRSATSRKCLNHCVTGQEFTDRSALGAFSFTPVFLFSPLTIALPTSSYSPSFVLNVLTTCARVTLSR